jgi:RNA polymerase sigma-70 factor (ECF subfamily)
VSDFGLSGDAAGQFTPDLSESASHLPNRTNAKNTPPRDETRQDVAHRYNGGRVSNGPTRPLPQVPAAPVSPAVAVPSAAEAATGTVARPTIPNAREETVELVVLPGPAVAPAADGTGTAVPTQPDRTPQSPVRPSPQDATGDVWRLVERAQEGDANAFAQIYERYLDTVFRFIYFRVTNRQLAEDLTAETFLRALKRIGSVSWQGRDLGAWLVTIARNLVADYFKSGRYRFEVSTGDVLDADGGGWADAQQRGPEGSPEVAVVDHITNVALLQAVQKLNPEQRECIILRFLQGFSVAETAQAMGKNEGAIKALQYRAVRALHRLLPEGFQP